MGSKGKEIVGVDLEKLLDMLNKAFADEWLAYYQYWVGARVAQGIMRQPVAAELEEHAQEELKHAEMLAERIMTLGGTPLLTPKAWFDKSDCGFAEPKDFQTKVLLEQNIRSERCAIIHYTKLLEFVKDKDPITYHMVLEILEEEVEHEEDLESILEDMKDIPTK